MTKKYVQRKISWCSKCRKQTLNKDIHKVLTLVTLIPQQSLMCKDCNARESVSVKRIQTQ